MNFSQNGGKLDITHWISTCWCNFVSDTFHKILYTTVIPQNKILSPFFSHIHSLLPDYNQYCLWSAQQFKLGLKNFIFYLFGICNCALSKINLLPRLHHACMRCFHCTVVILFIYVSVVQTEQTLYVCEWVQLGSPAHRSAMKRLAETAPTELSALKHLGRKRRKT